eukprot:2813257-Rhodomonas_salina.2
MYNYSAWYRVGPICTWCAYQIGLCYAYLLASVGSGSGRAEHSTSQYWPAHSKSVGHLSRHSASQYRTFPSKA